MSPPRIRALGLAALATSLLYLLSDVVEEVQGGFSDWQLWLTLVAEAAVPFVVLGLWLVQRPQLGRLGAAGALAYAYAFVFFTGTVVYALANGTPDYDALTDRLGVAMTVHGVIMVLAGLTFGWATIRAGVLPRWTGAALMAGVVLVAATQGAPAWASLSAAAIRDLAFAGMGIALLRAVPAPGARAQRLASPA